MSVDDGHEHRQTGWGVVVGISGVLLKSMKENKHDKFYIFSYETWINVWKG